MFYIHQTEKWLDQVITSINHLQLKPEDSRFMIALFSSMDFEFVTYFKDNKERISSFSGNNFHIFTPLIFDDNLISDDEWRLLQYEFTQMNIPISVDPTLIFFKLNKNEDGIYEPNFFAGYSVPSFNNFHNKLKIAINDSVRIQDTDLLIRRLTETFGSRNIISNDKIDSGIKYIISGKLNKPKIFVSHASIDKPFVNKLVSSLADSELKFWIDEKEIRPGDDFQHTISDNLRSSDYVIVVVSENSVKSQWVNFELSQYMGFSGNNNIIPVVISNNQRFSEPIDNFLRRINYIDFTDDDKWELNIERLREVLILKPHQVF